LESGTEVSHRTGRGAPCCLRREDRGDGRSGRRGLHDRPPGGESVRVAARPLLAHRI